MDPNTDPFEDQVTEEFENSVEDQEYEKELDSQPEMLNDAPEPEAKPLAVWVNAGFGHGSYECFIDADRTMVLPEALVRELCLSPGDDVDMEFDETEGVLYVSRKEKGWDAPDWLVDDPEEEAKEESASAADPAIE